MEDSSSKMWCIKSFRGVLKSVTEITWLILSIFVAHSPVRLWCCITSHQQKAFSHISVCLALTQVQRSNGGIARLVVPLSLSLFDTAEGRSRQQLQSHTHTGWGGPSPNPLLTCVYLLLTSSCWSGLLHTSHQLPCCYFTPAKLFFPSEQGSARTESHLSVSNLAARSIKCLILSHPSQRHQRPETSETS